jgi:hypothetical protein
MKRPEPAKKRIGKFLAKQTRGGAKGWSHKDAPDQRQQSKVVHSMDAVLWAMELGLTANQPSLRDVEEMTENLGPLMRNLVPGSISDSTLDTEAQRLDAEYLQKKLVQRVRGFHRSKRLKPEGLPCGVAVIDGKNLATLNHDADGTGHKRSKKNEKWHLSKEEETNKGTSYYLMPALRAVLCSAEAKPCIYQLPLPPGVGESKMVPEILKRLKSAYGHGDMFRVIDGDAGLTSLSNANLTIEEGYEYVLGLKGNQQELFAEAQALLLPSTESMVPELQTPWEFRNGKRIRRSLWRTDEMAGMENSVGKWTHLHQTWLVRQETREPGEETKREDRFFVTSLTWDFLSAAQILLLVRNHWAVENDCFNSLDLQWKEDSGPWCTRGLAIWGLGMLRMLAYNTAQLLRRCRLRKKRSDGILTAPRSWRSLFKAIEKSFELDAEALCTG